MNNLQKQKQRPAFLTKATQAAAVTFVASGRRNGRGYAESADIAAAPGHAAVEPISTKPSQAIQIEVLLDV